MKEQGKKTKTPKKPSTPEQRKEACARHWRRTGVSESTVKWMRENGML